MAGATCSSETQPRKGKTWPANPAGRRQSTRAFRCVCCAPLCPPSSVPWGGFSAIQRAHCGNSARVCGMSG